MARRKRKPVKSQKRQPPQAELRVEAVEDDGWTWCYVEPENGVKLYSNETYTTVDDARQWARRAYPDVPLAEDQDG
jgi:hypothetical protein